MQPKPPAAPNSSVADAERLFKAAEARFHAATSSLDSLMAISASSLKQKLLLKKAEEELADALKAKEAAEAAFFLVKGDQTMPVKTLPSSESSATAILGTGVPSLPPAERQSSNFKLKSRLVAMSSFQTSFRRKSLTEQEEIELELTKVRACVMQTRGFSSLDVKQQDILFKTGERKMYDKEEVLIVQNDHDVGFFFVLVLGSFKYVVEGEAPKSGLISCTANGNVIGHFAPFYRRPRDSFVYSTPGSIAWKFSLRDIPGFVMQVDAQKPASHAPQTSFSSNDPQEWVEKVTRCNLQIEQLNRLLEDKANQLQDAKNAEAQCATQLQLARDSQAESVARCASLYDTISSQELQLQSLLSQAAAEKSSFIQEKEQLQLLFDKQQHMCVSLTAQVVALTASCERLQRQVDHHTLQHQHEKDQYIKEMESQYANIALDKQTCLEAASRAQSLEALCNDAQSQLASLQSSHLEQAQRIALMAEQLMKHEHDARLNQELVLSRRTRGCQTLSADDLERSSFDSKMDAAKCAVHQLRADCNQVLMQFSRDLHAERAQIAMLQHSVSEKDKALERFVAAAQQRSAEREQSFEQQLHECSSDLLLQSGARSRALGEAQEQLELSRRLHAQAESQVQLLKGKLDAGLLAQDSLQSQVELLQFENAAHEANVAGLRRLLSTKQGNSHDEAQSLSRDGNAPISFRESALLAHLEGRAKESEQRAESMMFQKNEAQSRCQLAELALDHFQRLCDSSLSLLRANVTNSIDGLSQPADSSQLHAPSRSASSLAVALQHHSRVQEAGELLASAASRWAAEDVERASTTDGHATVDCSSIVLLDEIHRLRLQLSHQHMRVMNSYAEGIKQFEQRSGAAS